MFSFYEFHSGAAESLFHFLFAITELELVLGRCLCSGVRSRTVVSMGLLSCQGSLRERGRLSVNHVTHMKHFQVCFGLTHSFHLCSVDMILVIKNY